MRPEAMAETGPIPMKADCILAFEIGRAVQQEC
ncbi:MAG: hypothetical protein ACD_54C00370G0001, partial [uncultured bacterium]